MNFLFTILYILLFIFCLSVLVVVHELGHLASAKFFKVYCKEFSVGFGPKIFSRKRKNGETYFSLRAIPFGGYVSMYGEGMEEDPDYQDIDPSRSFTNIKKWKRIIILFSGVFNNAILALILFLISESCFAQRMLYLSYVNVDAGSKAAVAEISNDAYISLRSYQNEQEKKVYYIVDNDTAYVTYGDDTTKKVSALLDPNSSDLTFTNRSYDNFLRFFLKNEKGDIVFGNEIVATDNAVKSITYSVTTAIGAYKQYIANEWVLVPNAPTQNPSNGQAYFDKENRILYKWNGSEWKKSSSDVVDYLVPQDAKDYYVWYDLEYEKTAHPLTLKVTTKDNKQAFEASGLSLYLDEYWNDAGAVFKNTFIDFGNSATAIGRGLASLFTSSESWKDVGGVIAIGVQTTNILQNFGLSKFIYIWGLISVNLAIINLLPFPGLDGWQIVVLIVEAVAHREIPDKVKTIVSFVGLAILFAFMIMILIKDFIGLF